MAAINPRTVPSRQRWLAHTAIAGLLIAAATCTDATGPKPQSTFLEFTSQAGDLIGQGESRRYVLADGSWSAEYDGEWVAVRFTTAGSSWSLDFAAPAGKTLKVGTYERAERFPFQAPSRPGLSFEGNGRGCNTLTGRFVIQYLERGPDNRVNRLNATFEQHCEGQSPSLSGSVAIVANPWK